MLTSTNYIKNKIKGHSLSNTDYRDYIRDLCDMENILLIPRPRGTKNTLRFSSLRQKYEKEYLAISKELDVNYHISTLREELSDEQELDKRLLKLYVGKKELLKREKKWWIALGGKE